MHTSPTPAEHERRRVAAHVAAGERAARTAMRTPRDPLRALLRMLLLDGLEAYHRAGVFPKNRVFPDARVPVFVDEEGTRCAIAHLMEQSGAAALLGRVCEAHRYSFVPEMVDLPEVVAWLTLTGLTVEEAARIQPTYGCYRAARMVCEGLGLRPAFQPPVDAVIEVCASPQAPRDGAPGDSVVVHAGAVYGASARHAVGDAVRVSPYALREGTNLLVMQGDGPTARGVFPLDGDGRLAFFDALSGATLSLTREQLVQALLSHDCVGALAAIDPRWRGERCDDGGGGAQPRPSAARGLCAVEATGGCDARAAAGGDGEAVVLAMIGSLLLRRARRGARGGGGAARPRPRPALLR